MVRSNNVLKKLEWQKHVLKTYIHQIISERFGSALKDGFDRSGYGELIVY